MRTAGPTCVLSALACALIAACTASAEDVRPPSNQLFFPTGLAVFPRTNALFVANSNSELRYDSGSLMVLDLGVVESTIGAWLSPAQDQGPCKPDPDHRETLVCDETMFFKPSSGVRIGNFATDLAVQDFSTPDPGGSVRLRVFAPTRGDPSVAWADYDGDTLSCFDSRSEDFPLCDEAHRLSSVFNDPANPPIPDEPFGVFATTQPASPSTADNPTPSRNGFAVVTHLTTGTVTLIDAPEDGTVQIVDARTGLFNIDPLTGLLGASGVAGRSPGTDNDVVYVASRSDPRIWTFTVGRPVNLAPPYLLEAGYVLETAIGNGFVGQASDTRGMQFSESGDRLYVVNRRPPALQVFDTSIGPLGTPLNMPLGASDLCRQASTVTVVDFGRDVGARAYVTCFQDGQVYVVDTRGQSQVEDIITVGRGPYSIAAAKDLKQLFVSNYLEDTIAVIDVDPMSPTRNRVVLRIGQPRPL